jgi:hypothetical protein
MATENLIRVSDLTDDLLDCWVAKADGHAVRSVGGRQWQEQWPAGHWLYIRHPSSIWEDGGPIIEKEGIALLPMLLSSDMEPRTWVAHYRNVGSTHVPEGEGETPLIAAMRAYVASRFGPVVPKG